MVNWQVWDITYLTIMIVWYNNNLIFVLNNKFEVAYTLGINGQFMHLYGNIYPEICALLLSIGIGKLCWHQASVLLPGLKLYSSTLAPGICAPIRNSSTLAPGISGTALSSPLPDWYKELKGQTNCLVVNQDAKCYSILLGTWPQLWLTYATILDQMSPPPPLGTVNLDPAITYL